MYKTPSEHRFRFVIFTMVVVLIWLSACRSRDADMTDSEKEDPTLTFAYEENDTLALRPIPPNLQQWLDYYYQFDTSFRNINFKASGVTIHLDTLSPSGTKADEASFKPLLAYSPDSSKIIDFWSYSQAAEKKADGTTVIIGGSPDQEVVLFSKKNNSSRQLMYNGTLQVVETADWINENSFVLSLLNTNDSGTIIIPEVYLFNLHDSTFTNFRFIKEIRTDSLRLKNADFMKSWLSDRNYTRE